MDVDRWIEQVRRCACLDEASMRRLCDAVPHWMSSSVLMAR